jgi:hypothetical protein
VHEDADVETLLADPLSEQAAVMYIALSELIEMLSRAADPS